VDYFTFLILSQHRHLASFLYEINTSERRLAKIHDEANLHMPFSFPTDSPTHADIGAQEPAEPFQAPSHAPEVGFPHKEFALHEVRASTLSA
jgi:hypothetical protein